MLQRLRSLWVAVFLFLTPLALYAQEPKNTAYKGENPRSGAGEAFTDLMKTWWLWVGILAIVGLLGVLFYLRNKTDD
jgi:hypothetical protein